VSIKPPTDIVLDVAKAADPAKALAAADRLVRMGSTGRASEIGFSDVLKQMPNSPETELANVRGQMTQAGKEAAKISSASNPQAKAYKALEALVLQNLVETMLPKDSEGLFGQGMAGEVWRSMLAERLGTQLSTSIDLGLAPKTTSSKPPSPGFPATDVQASNEVPSHPNDESDRVVSSPV
jgi:hypothetical protein